MSAPILKDGVLHEKGKDMDIKESIVVNGVILHQASNGLWVNSEGSSGYHAHFTGAWVCYTDGHLCECGE